MEFDKGQLVWFDPGLGYVLPGEVLEFHKAGQVITVQAVIGGKPQVFTMTNLSTVKKRQDLGEDGIGDMINLGDLNEASILWNLKIRYDKEKIYTYIGSILVAVNPYRMFDIYGLDIVKKYEGKILGTLPPHIFAIGSAAYSHMSKDNGSECVIISGESGAGKTESTKLIMQYLAAVNKSQSNLITEQILEASPLLESFGNAKTIKNDNSSRFGKYLECFFKDGIITGAKITEYLLEKSRIVTQAADERNYHVFYELLAGLGKEKKAKYGLTTPNKYFYLNQGESCTLPNKDDSSDFQALMSAMQVLGFSAEEQDTIFRILASVLHLGNIYFHRKQLRHGLEGVEVGSDSEIKWASHLLQIDPEGIQQALTAKVTETRHERVLIPLNIDQALDSRDAVAKALYSALFSWLVRRVNSIIKKGAKKTCISILDIFGFEVFKDNSLEQMCINYANEKLQFYFNKYIFKLEQQEYSKERIEWQNIDFQDNIPAIDLIARKPVGILHLLDDESNFPKATDISFLEKCHYNHALNDLYSRPRMSSMEFGIKHYAGQVWYNVEGFLDKNRDTLRNDVVELLISSKLPMLSEMFIDLRMGSETKTFNKATGRFITMKPRTPTVAARFNDSLSCLIDSMSKANPWFIRCIKPNNDKAPLKLDMPLVLEQLRYSGMLETIRIRQIGFPVRLRFAHFADRYRCLVPGKVPKGAPAREICRVVLERSVTMKNRSRGYYQFGSSKIFLKEALEKALEQERYKRLSHAVVTIQRHTRGLLARKKYNSYKRAATKIQASIRMWQARNRYQTLRRGVLKAQAVMRGRTTRRQFLRMKEEASRRKKVEEIARQRAARQTSQTEQQAERGAQRSVAGVNHLEVPAELAYIFSKTAEWKGHYPGQGHITRVSNPLQCESSHYRLPHDVDYYAFTKFTNVYFKSHLWGMKREPIKTPFLPKQRDSDYADSLAVFKLILRFMNDPALSGVKETILGNYITNKGIQNERMRDEILCQLSNQTWRNENLANLERGWLLMANCLSVFLPSQSLYKYLLKYVSDHGYDGYANLCQRKLLSASKNSSGMARCFGPTELEWRANRTKSKMALTAQYPDGKSNTAEVDSWTTAEEFASTLLQERGINDSLGWSLTMTEYDVQKEVTYLDYVLDIIGERELPPSFPVGNSCVLSSNNHSAKKHKISLHQSVGGPLKNNLEESPLIARKTRSPPPLTRKLSREALAAHDSRNDKSEGAIALSRTSALNNRYFDDKSKSRSMDTLIDPSSRDVKDLGLSRSKLNERYHSMDGLAETNGFSHELNSPLEFDNMESISQRGMNGEVITNGSRLVTGKGLEGSKMWSKFSLHTEERNGLDNMKIEYPKVLPSRFIKANNIQARRNHVGASNNSRGHIERGDYVKSSALSDTSETPSLASHVRRVRVPSQASDVDQFLDDLFMPVLDHQLDELSDARSLAASIKGGAKRDLCNKEKGTTEHVRSFPCSSTPEESLIRKSFMDNLQEISPTSSLSDLVSTSAIISSIKGGGNGTTDVETTIPTSSSASMNGNNYPGLNSGVSVTPNSVEPNSIVNYQQNVQRAFLQSAVAQNIQIQQHLMAQNQALQQLIHQSIPVHESDQSELWSTEKIRSSSMRENHNASGFSNHLGSSPPSLMPLNSSFSPASMSFHQAAAASSPVPGQSPRKNSRSPEDRKGSYERGISTRGNPRSPPPYFNEQMDGHQFGIVPPPPPMPEKDSSGNFIDPYQRAKTVRIGKWRWPPPKDEDEVGDSFLHFKMKQNIKKSIKADGKEPFKPNSRDDSGEIEWEEFEIANRKHELNHSKKENYYNHQNHQHTSNNNRGMNGDHNPDLFLMQKQQHMKYHKAVKQERINHRENGERIENNHFSMDGVDAKGFKESRHKGDVKRKDSWGSDGDEDGDKEGGIGKLQIPREMRQKLEALTSSHPSRVSTGGGKYSKDRGVKKLEQNRRYLLEQQLGNDQWDVSESVQDIKRPPSPIGPGERRHRPLSPTISLTSQGSSPLVPHTRSPPIPIKPSGYQNHNSSHHLEYHNKERRGSISTIQTERTEQIELEESAEFLKPVDRAPRLKDEEKEKKSVEGMKTRLLPGLQGSHLCYGKVPWKLHIRKEIFTPDEVLSPEALHLVFCQVVLEAFEGSSRRINSEEKSRLILALEGNGITPGNFLSPQHKRNAKKEIVELAKTFPLYFSSIFPVTGSRKIDAVEYLAVSHTGIRILKRIHNEYKIMETYNLEDIEEAKCSRPGSLHLFLSTGSGMVLYLQQAKQVSLLLTRFLSIIHAGSRDFVRAIADYVTREPSLLSFRKGDVIRVTNSDAMKYSDKGWLHGVLDGRTGMFPVEYVTHIGRNEARQSSKNGGDSGIVINKRAVRDFAKSPDRGDTSPGFVSGSEGVSGTTWTVTKGSSSPHHDDSGHSSGGEVTDETQKTSVDDGKHSLFQFALQHFRGAKESGIADGSLQMAMQKAKKKKGSKEGTPWTWKDLVELVKFSQSPLKVSLLSLDGELNSLAVETFTAIMRYMGDFPMDAQQTEVHCVYFILMNCHKHETLRDEVYCQVMKQTTNNKSSIPDSCQRGWRLFSIIAAYFTCSEVLKPYLLKYLETNAYDKRRAFHGTAMVCLQNIRKTFRYGGRKNVPSIEEITAITAGRNSKRQIYRLPGGTERVINTKSTSVVQDILEELCALINVRSQQEQEEFSLYCIVDGDSFTMPLAREEYVLDVTTELLKNKQIFYLVFCRSVYYYPLRLDNGLYIEVVFNQIAPDYLAGFLLVTPGEHLGQDIIYDVAKIAALMHRAADLDHIPTIKEVKYLLPRPLLKARDVKPPAWVSLVQSSWPDAVALSCMEAKAVVLEILQKWPLFGSAFFDVQRISEPEESVHTILALNKGGVHFLDPNTHESLLTFPLDKIMSTRKVKGNDGELYLDMKCGNLMKPKIITLKTNQAHEISRQIRQYITIEQRFNVGGQGDNPRDVTLTR